MEGGICIESNDTMEIRTVTIQDIKTKELLAQVFIDDDLVKALVQDDLEVLVNGKVLIE